MVYPVYLYGMPVLRKVAQDNDLNDPDLPRLIDDMWETMYHSDGIGLAAPQIGKSTRLFVVDATLLKEEYPEAGDFKETFLNARKVEESGDPWVFNEGCLSLPNLREDITRKSKIRLQYYDRDHKYHDKTFDGVIARIIQHEYDHIEGILFIDYLAPLRKKLLKSKLNAISKGKVDIKYKIKTFS
ncbi:MAG: peptide deformylase [Bacteroidetes bacterium]|jgi:peptide deformylase|nr:peptide deformylase [Bacteroidota bacterium]